MNHANQQLQHRVHALLLSGVGCSLCLAFTWVRPVTLSAPSSSLHRFTSRTQRVQFTLNASGQLENFSSFSSVRHRGQTQVP